MQEARVTQQLLIDGIAGRPKAFERRPQHERQCRNQVLCSRSEDFNEGIRAFLKSESLGISGDNKRAAKDKIPGGAK
jgi:hypothetical protein